MSESKLVQIRETGWKVANRICGQIRAGDIRALGIRKKYRQMPVKSSILEDHVPYIPARSVKAK
jgi:hypothetical protein